MERLSRRFPAAQGQSARGRTSKAEAIVLPSILAALRSMAGSKARGGGRAESANPVIMGTSGREAISTLQHRVGEIAHGLYFYSYMT